MRSSVTWLTVLGSAMLALPGCIPASSGDYADIRFKNDTSERVELHGCNPGGDELGTKSCEGNSYEGSDKPVRIGPHGSAKTDMATGISFWHERRSDRCYVVVGVDTTRTVQISRGQPCDELERDYQRELCPDTSSPDGWWHRDSDDGRSCERHRRDAGLACENDKCVGRPTEDIDAVVESNASSQR